MTQFMLCITDVLTIAPDLVMQPLDQPVLREAAEALFPDVVQVVVPRHRNGHSIDGLFTDAHNAVYNGRPFGTTRLSEILPRLIEQCDSFALWWGNDWSDLPLFDDSDALIDDIVQQLRGPVGEVYALWRPS